MGSTYTVESLLCFLLTSRSRYFFSHVCDRYSPLLLALRSRSTGKESTVLETVVGGWQMILVDCKAGVVTAAAAAATTVVVVEEFAFTVVTPLLLVTVVVIAVAAETVSVVAVVAADVDDGEACW